MWFKFRILGDHPGLSGGPQHNHTGPCKRETEGKQMAEKEEGGEGSKGRKDDVMGGAWTNGWGQPPEAAKSKETDFPLEPLEGSWPGRHWLWFGSDETLFGFLARRDVRELMHALFTPLVWDSLLQLSDCNRGLYRGLTKQMTSLCSAHLPIHKMGRFRSCTGCWEDQNSCLSSQ